ncbi:MULTISPECIES: hypothetical protein [unclassified Thioalkalivibrio]|uniref:hypothetical protein n=1 Tax=unclassified Thioalkalivibrio TaxID=2621013 RepID=UPI001E44FB43|nr:MULTISPECIES: hypothetical protein [unclassified Thioalkalivibrio]
MQLAPDSMSPVARVGSVSEITAHSLLRHSAAHPPALEPDSAGPLVPARFDDDADRANRRVTVRSNLPGLAPDWDPFAAFRLSTRTRSVEQANDAPVGAPEESIGQLLTPRFQRFLPDGREYYFWIDRSLPDIEHRGGHYHIHRQTITVRVQWRRNTENDDLPRVLPAPAPTEPRPDDLLTPDFERTGQPGWADERTYPADGGGTVRIRSQRHCRPHPP